MILNILQKFSRLIYQINFIQILLGIYLFVSFGFAFNFIFSEWNFVRHPVSLKPWLVFYKIILSLFPLVLIFHPENSRIRESSIRIFTALKEKYDKSHLIFMFFFISIFLFLSYQMVPTIGERIRWFSSFYIPFFTPDPPFPANLSYYLYKLIPLELVTPFINVSILIIWFCFLCYIRPKTNKFILIFGFSIAFLNANTISIASWANYEITASLLSTIGIYGFYRQNYPIGITFLLLGLLFKSSSIFFIIIAALFMIYDYLVEHKKIQLSFSYLTAVVLFIGLNYAIFVAYVGSRGVTYVFQVSEATFFWDAFVGFSKDLIFNYPLLSLTAFIGLLDKKNIKFNLIAFVFLFLVRCLSRMSGSYYSLFFIPILSLLSVDGIAMVISIVSKYRARLEKIIYVCFAILISMVLLTHQKERDANVFTQNNSNWKNIVRELSSELPIGTTVMERKIDLYPYLMGNGRDDLKYIYYPEKKSDVLKMLRDNKPQMIISPLNDLGITDEELTQLGFVKKYKVGAPKGMKWRIFIKNL